VKPFTTLEAVAVPLEMTNVDTDRIIPARFLSKPRTEQGLGAYAFHDERFDPAGNRREEFPLNQGAYREARIIVSDDNFGCGSSRESAVWALADLYGTRGDGILAIIAPSFGDIFYNNACKNGVLPVRLEAEVCREMRAWLRERPGSTIYMDLPEQLVRGPDGKEHRFEIDGYRKMCLFEGLDDISMSLRETGAIQAHERRVAAERPWRLVSPPEGAKA
jgi:3-isopropylmalate/(R)-2-methylmalate dehydratase small subunit